MQVRQIISSHPEFGNDENDALLRCIEECYSCGQACTSCADACLAEEMVAQLRQCIRLNLDCADLCAAVGSVATRRTGRNVEVLAALLNACAVACRLCADECWKHSEQHQHCRICAEACRRCAEACSEAVHSIRAES